MPPFLAGYRMPGQWVLEEQVTGRPRFVGQPEGGMRDTGAGYFLLMKVGCSQLLFVRATSPMRQHLSWAPGLYVLGNKVCVPS